METELLAQQVELLSVVASERKLKKPIQLPRPGQVRPASASNSAHGHLAVAAMFARKAG